MRLTGLLYAAVMLPLLARAETGVSLAPAVSVRSRVVIIRDSQATHLFEPSLPNIRVMFDRGLMYFTHTTNMADAWRPFVSTNDTVGLKVFSSPGAISGTRPAVVEAMVQSLLAAGLPPRQIVVWDKREDDLRTAGFFALADKYGIRVQGSAETGYDPEIFYETPLIGYLTWGDFEFSGKNENTGRKSFVTRILTKELTKVINVSPLLNNNAAGVSGNLFSLTMGSIDNSLRFESEADRLARAVPEIYAMPQVGDHVVLNVTDALICQYEGGEHSMLHYSAVLNELRLSRDPVALDVLSLDELVKQRKLGHSAEVKFDRDLYSNASLLELGASDLEKIMVERMP